MNIEEIKSNWSKTDEIIYKDPTTKLKSLEAANTKVIAKT